MQIAPLARGTGLNEQIADFTSHVVLDHDSLGFPASHARSLEQYHNSVIRPALSTLNRKIIELKDSGNYSCEFELAILEPMHQDTVKGFLLATQAMWERSLRAMLVSRATKLGKDENYIACIRRSVWFHERNHDLHKFFQDLIGLSIQSFDAYRDLNILQLLGNVLRHGDGPSSERLYECCPRLWLNLPPPATQLVLEPFSTEVQGVEPKSPSTREMTIPTDVLEHLIQVVCGFWNDIEYIRCNSFKCKYPSTVKNLADHLEGRDSRKKIANWHLNKA